MSAILSVDDLNDFISPGVACIKPIETLPAEAANSNGAATGETEVMLDGQQPHAPSPAAAAQISLTDCLACSGCVTSAEAVLVSLQSHNEVLATLDAAPALRLVRDADGVDAPPRVHGLDHADAKLLVVSVCPQTRASLAAACPAQATSDDDVRRMLDGLFRGDEGLAAGGKWRNRFSWVADTNVARDLGLVLAADEALGTTAADVAPPSRPVLASSCPGWVCYAEKTHPHVLPHLSRVKSPQALMGTLLKTTLSRKLGIPPSRIWHLAVMPCFDKKLEASREELTDQAWGGAGSLGKGIRDVDCVITSKEVLMLCESRGINFFQLPRNAASIPPPEPFPDSRLHDFLFARQPPRAPHRAAGSSGGLLHHILQTRASQTPGSDIQIVRGRNADVVEYTVSLEGQPIFRAARYYGFRNIQNLVRRLKPARPSRMPGGKPFGSARRPAGKSAASLEYGYVEVMACPGGCTNGGGQIKADDPIVVERKNLGGQPGLQEQKDWLAEVDEAYFSGSEVDGDGAPSGREGIDGNFPSYIHDTLAYWSAMTGISLDRLAFTSYREVVSDVGKDRATDAEKVVQLAGKVGGGW